MATRYSSDVPATTLTDLTNGGVAATKGGTYLLNLCNRGGVTRTFRVALSANVGSGSVGLGDYIEYEMKIEPQGVFSRHPIPLADGWKVWVYASGAGLSATLIGLEEV